jgi:tetratricopeptide (TPR) repeat protein
MEIKLRLIQLIEQAYAEQQALMERLPEEIRAQEGQPDRWTPKDAIGHLAGWTARTAEQLEDAAAGRLPADYSDYESINTREFEQNRHTPWPGLLAASREACRRLARQVDARDKSDLLGAHALPFLQGRPLWRLIVNGCFVHAVAMHLNPVYIECGQSAHAIDLAERSAEWLAELDPAADWQGLVQYNLGCTLALAGDKEGALAAVREGLSLNPSLTEWSRQDPDLISLRDERAFQALYVGKEE